MIHNIIIWLVFVIAVCQFVVNYINGNRIDDLEMVNRGLSSRINNMLRQPVYTTMFGPTGASMIRLEDVLLISDHSIHYMISRYKKTTGITITFDMIIQIYNIDVNISCVDDIIRKLHKQYKRFYNHLNIPTTDGEIYVIRIPVYSHVNLDNYIDDVLLALEK